MIYLARTFTYGMDLGYIQLFQKRIPNQYSFFHHFEARDWCKSLLVFSNLQHNLHCSQTIWSIPCNFRQLLKRGACIYL